MKRRHRITTKFRYRGRVIHGCVFLYNHSIYHRNGYIEYADGVEGLEDTYPLGILHPWGPGESNTSPIPIGSVQFISKPDGLYFKAIISDTTAGNEALTLVRDRALRSVSIGITHLEYEYDDDGNVIVTRSKPYELSLCPTGMGAFPEARVH